MDKKPHNIQQKAKSIEEAEQRETPTAHEAFLLYLSMPVNGGKDEKRSARNLAAKMGHPPSYARQIENWSRLLLWQERIKAIEDKELAGLIARKRKELEEKLDRMNDEQAKVARGLWIKAAKGLDELLASDKGMYGRDLVELLKAAVAIERLANGEATARIAQETSFNPEKPLIISAEFGVGTVEDKEGQ